MPLQLVGKLTSASPDGYAQDVVGSHRARVEELLSEAEAAHRNLIAAVPEAVAASLPVDAQGITRAIDHLADALGFSAQQRRRLVLPHAVNPAVMHARVFGATPLTAGTVIGAFVDGARVRANALIAVADTIGDAELVAGVRRLLIDHPLPTPEQRDITQDPAEALKDAYAAQERAAVLIATALDDS